MNISNIDEVLGLIGERDSLLMWHSKLSKYGIGEMYGCVAEDHPSLTAETIESIKNIIINDIKNKIYELDSKLESLGVNVEVTV